MDSVVKVYLKRSFNEVNVAEILFKVSGNNEKKKEFNIEEGASFYSAVISHAYYSIFYSAKALLLTKGIKTEFPEVHRKTLEEFKKNFVDSGILDVELLKIYNKMIVRADELLGLFRLEKGKRGRFTYKTIPQANIEPADESVKNAKKFITHVKQVIECKKWKKL